MWLIGYYKWFVANYGKIARSLTELLKKEASQWHPEAQEAFERLKNALIIAPALALPNFDEVFIVETDASRDGTGAILTQKRHPLAFISKVLAPKISCCPSMKRR